MGPDTHIAQGTDNMDQIERHAADLLLAACGLPSPVVKHGLRQFDLRLDVLSLPEADQSYIRLLFEIGHAIFMIEAYSLLYTAAVDGSLSQTITMCIDPELRAFLNSAPAIFREGIPSRTLSAFAQGLADLTSSARLHVASIFDNWLQNTGNRTLFLETCIRTRHECRYLISILHVTNNLYKQSIDNVAAYKRVRNKSTTPLLVRGIHLYNYMLTLLDKNGPEYNDAVLRITRPVAREVASMIHSFLAHGFVSDPYSEFFAVPVELEGDSYSHGVLDNKIRDFMYCFDSENYTSLLKEISPPTYVAVVAPGCSLIKNHFPSFLKSEQAKQLVMVARCNRISGVRQETQDLLKELEAIVGLEELTAFNRIKFDRCLDKLVRLSSQSLWIHLLQNGILNHIKIIFEIAFLRQADVSQCILDGAKTALKSPTTTRLMNRSFNIALEKAFALCYKYLPETTIEFEAFCERKIGSREAVASGFIARQPEKVDYDMLRFVVDDFSNNNMCMYDEQKELLSLFQLTYTEYNPQNEFIADHLLYRRGGEDESSDPGQGRSTLTQQQIEFLPIDKQLKHRRKRSMRQPFYDSELSVYPLLQHNKHDGYVKHFLPICSPIFQLLVLKYSCDNTISLFLAPHYISLFSKVFKVLLALKYTQHVVKSTYLLIIRKTSPCIAFTKAYGAGATGLRLAPKYDQPSAFGLQVLVLRILPFIISTILLFFDRLFFFLEVKHLSPKITEFINEIIKISRACYNNNDENTEILGFSHANDLMNSFLCSLIVKFSFKDDKISSLLRYICELTHELCALVTRATESGLLSRGLKEHLRPPSSEYSHLYSQLLAYKQELEEVILEFEEAIQGNQ